MKNKKLLCVLAALLMGTSISAMPSFAAENEVFGENYTVVNEEEYQDYLSTLSDEQLEEIAAKQAMMEKVNQMMPYSLNATKLSISGTFTMYQQQTDTYCCPACIESTLMYINGSSPSQSSINSSINMDFTRITNYVNNRQSRSPYIYLSSPTQSQLTACIKTSINVAIPTFLRIAETSTPIWYYDTDGHCVLSNAIYDDNSKIQIADPLGERGSGCPYFYEKNASTVHDYTTDLIY